MAIETNTFTTYAQKGIREDLSDTIYMISPTATPVISAIGKGTAGNTLHEWQTDALAAPNSAGSLEGDVFAAAARTPTTRVNNNVMILKRSLEVTRTAQKVKAAGRRDEYKYQVMKEGKNLRRDMEFTILQNVAPSAGSATVARQLRSLPSWYATNVINVGTGGANGSTTTARTDGTQSNLSEATLISALQSCFTNGAEPTMAVCGPVNRSKVTGFNGGGTVQKRVDADKKVMVNSVTVYESDFGDIRVVPNRWSRERDLHLIDPDYLKIAVLDDIHVEERAKTSDADKAEILVEFTLENSNEAAHALIADLTTT